MRIKRTLVESGLHEAIKADLLSPEIITDVEQETRRALKAHRRAARPDPKRIAVAEEEIGNLVQAIATGKLHDSQVLAERLAMVEAELTTLKAAARTVTTQDIEGLVRLVMERYHAMVSSVDFSLPIADSDEARAQLRGIFGCIKVVSDAQEIRFEADLRDTHLALLRGVGGSANNAVAGACFGLIQ